jgi:hypothetical protein
LQNSLEDRENIDYSSLNFNLFLPIGKHISQIFKNFLESDKWLPTLFQKSSVQIRKMCGTNRKRGISFYILSTNKFGKFKVFDAQWLRHYLLNMIIKAELKNN